ncbi:LuxR family transcriptional regulator, partial [cyanobacterium TDX16]
MGKSALLEEATAGAPALTRLKVDGYEAESSIPFAAVNRLLIPLRAHLTDLPERHRDALLVAAGTAEGPPPDRFLVALGVLGLLAAAADDQALVCAVDDAHLLDAESLDVLTFVARRLEADPVALVLAGRADDALAARTAGLPTLPLGGLPADAAITLLRSSLAGDVDPIAA